MSAASTRCTRCPDTQTHLVRTRGGVYRTCGPCADDLVATRGDVVRVSVLPGGTTRPPVKRPKSKPVWVEAKELLPDNPFAAAVTGVLADAKGATR